MPKNWSKTSCNMSKGPSIKDIPFFWPILDLLTYLYPIFGPIFGHIYLYITIHIRFLQTYLLTGAWDILYGKPLIVEIAQTHWPADRLLAYQVPFMLIRFV